MGYSVGREFDERQGEQIIIDPNDSQEHHLGGRRLKVFLKSGKVYEGEIIEYTYGEYIKLMQPPSGIDRQYINLNIKWEEIKSIKFTMHTKNTTRNFLAIVGIIVDYNIIMQILARRALSGVSL
ncbi:MAG: hypothetical protein P9L92_00380 [Candidatus Electryonea clarkiae]|nr:hypothetical protein [Candidatus Electryonea clarkiae]